MAPTRGKPTRRNDAVHTATGARVTAARANARSRAVRQIAAAQGAAGTPCEQWALCQDASTMGWGVIGPCSSGAHGCPAATSGFNDAGSRGPQSADSAQCVTGDEFERLVRLASELRGTGSTS
jgi:hypothetical protein